MVDAGGFEPDRDRQAIFPQDRDQAHEVIGAVGIVRCRRRVLPGTGLCCTNHLMTGLPLSPDRPILRPL